MPKPILTGTDGSDVITGQLIAEAIYGLAGDDTINGGGGDDDIYGGDGDDTLIGGAGNDLLSGGAGIDTAVFSGNLRDYNFTTGLDGTMTAVHARGSRADGSDTVQSDVEILRFADRTIDLRVNNAPEVQNDTRTIHEDARILNGPSVLLNDFDAETYLGRQHMTVTAVNGSTESIGGPITLPSGAQLTMRPDGTYDYDPTSGLSSLSAGETYLETITYTATDSAGASSTGTLTIPVTGRNDAPVASSQTITLAANEPDITGTLRADDVDSDDSPTSLTYQIVSGPADGTLTMDGNGFRYVPGASFGDLGAGESRDVSVAYRAIDQHGAASNIATTTFHVVGVNDAPVVTEAVLTGEVTERPDGAGENLAPDHEVSGTITFTDLDINDQHTVTITPAGSGYLGTVTEESDFVSGGGTVNWKFQVADADIDFLAQGEIRTQVYDVTISDGTVSVTQQIAVNLHGTNDAPEFISADGSFAFAVTEDLPAGTIVGQALALDPDGTVTYSIVGGTGQGEFSIDANGNVTTSRSLDHETEPHLTLDVQARDLNGATTLAHLDIDVLDRAPIIYNLTTDRQVHTITGWESNDLVRIHRLSSDLSLQYAEAPGIYLDLASAKTAADIAQVGIVDVGVAYYRDASGVLNAVASIDEDAFGNAADGWVLFHDVQVGQISSANFVFV